MSAGHLSRARERFRVGDRVKLSEDGHDKYPMLSNQNAKGVVVGFPRVRLHHNSREWEIRVKLDRSTAVRTYLSRYFELDPDAPQACVTTGAP